jgi:glucose/arabinose dehydrogenase
MVRSLCLVVVLSMLGCAGPGASLKGTFGGADAKREQVPVRLERVAAGGTAVSVPGIVTELRAWPGDDDVLLVASKRGSLHWHRLSDGATGELLNQDQLGPVGDYVEEGLLGFAFAPGFGAGGGVLYSSQTQPSKGGTTSVARAWTVTRSGDQVAATGGEQIYAAEQPGKGHHGGQIQVDADGHLYLGLGDGGSQNDPDEMGQRIDNPQCALIRITPKAGGGYDVPADNFGAVTANCIPETYAYGFRNPWRFSLDEGRIVVGDVGQGKYEEINLVVPGGNHGWSLKEGRECFRPDRQREVPGSCDDPSLVDPVWTYPRSEGMAVVGGYVYRGSALPALVGKYVFGDHATGRLWALTLPAEAGQEGTVEALGKFDNLSLTTFGQGAGGELLVGTMNGTVWRIAPR